jgi:pectin methylesterase-like acyl-CoA thioesterase
MRTQLIVTAVLVLAGLCSGATIMVNQDGTGDYVSIQSAIDAAADLDTVVVCEGRYEENINIGGKNIVLTSTEPGNWCVVKATIIDGGRSGCVVTFGGSETSECVIEGLTIANGYNSTHGGGGGYKVTAAMRL